MHMNPSSGPPRIPQLLQIMHSVGNHRRDTKHGFIGLMYSSMFSCLQHNDNV